MSITGSKNNKAMSVMSTKSDGGKALDKHCFGTTTKGKECNGKIISGKNFSRHVKEEHEGNKPETIKACIKDGCEHCTNHKGKIIIIF
jgi:hypothetical protein